MLESLVVQLTGEESRKCENISEFISFLGQELNPKQVGSDIISFISILGQELNPKQVRSDIISFSEPNYIRILLTLSLSNFTVDIDDLQFNFLNFNMYFYQDITFWFPGSGSRSKGQNINQNLFAIKTQISTIEQ